MAKLLHPLLMVLARATDRELARMVDYLKAENEILRARLPKRIVTTPAERARLVRVGKPLGTAIKNLITIVTPRTFARPDSLAIVLPRIPPAPAKPPPPRKTPADPPPNWLTGSSRAWLGQASRRRQPKHWPGTVTSDGH